jgi:hypothetical protein
VNTIHYLNTDLDIACSENPGSLANALKKAGLHKVNSPQLADGRWIVNFETNKQFAEPAASIAAILEVIANLDGDALTQWHGCALRECNKGFEGGGSPQPAEFKLPAELLARMASTGVSLGITIYPQQ